MVRRAVPLALFLTTLSSVPGAARAAGVQGDATVLGGITAAGGDARGGLRFAEVAVAPADGLRAWAQYDDALSLDNLALSRAGTHVPSFYLGGLRAWGGPAITRLEAGYRRLAGGVDQPILRGEQVHVAGRTLALKAGGWVGPRSDGRTETIAHAGLSLGAALRLEPTFFWARSGLAGEQEVRLALSAVWAFAPGGELVAGAAAGRAFAPSPAPEGTPAAAWAKVSVPLRGARLHAQIGREWPVASPAATVAVVGATFSAGGRP